MPKAQGEKREKKTKDPNAPKKPCGAYMWFCKEMRESVKEEHPDWGFTEIGRRLGEMWKNTDEAVKKVYQDMAEKDKERYSKEASTYRAGY